VLITYEMAKYQLPMLHTNQLQR